MRHWGAAFVLGAGVTAAAIAFGSRPLGVVGIGLLVAAGLTRMWAALVGGPASVTHVVEPTPAVEGDRVRLAIEAHRASSVPVGSHVVRGTLGRLGPYECRLRGHGRTATATVELGALPRGCFALSGAELVLSDFLGLEAVVASVRFPPATVVVHPRLVELDGLFSEAGQVLGYGRRRLLRRPAGFDFHSVRDYEPGESLRRVHWPSSARRGQLMVKELEDTPRDAVVVLLDCDPAGAAGESPESSFDTAVRAAGSLVKNHVTRGRTVILLTTGGDPNVASVRPGAAGLPAALSALAAAEPDAREGLARSLRRVRTTLEHVGELVVVTSMVEPGAAVALLALATRRPVSVVWIDAPSWVSRPSRANAGVRRLFASGIPVASVRCGDDLAEALGARRLELAARG